MWRDITEIDKVLFNNLITHPLQSYEWGEFREKTGLTVVRRGFFEKNKLSEVFQVTIHQVPYTSFTIGYLPKGTIPTQRLIDELQSVGKKYKCIFIQIEPNIQTTEQNIKLLEELHVPSSAHPLFTKYTFQLDLTKSEEELLKNMHPKTRYNIRIAQKHHIEVKQETSENAFNKYLALTKETTSRQGFFAHTPKYHAQMWDTLKNNNNKQLQAHLFVAWFTPENKQPVALTTWILFQLHNTLYYPYGASSSQYRETMSSNLMMWEAIKFGKKEKLTLFDMWGSMGQDPDTKDPWYGFHRFKMGYGPRLVEFVGSYDVVVNPFVYQFYKIANKARWFLLSFKK